MTWAVKHHRALRFRPDATFGYPKKYVQWFGEDFEPAEYMKAEWDYCANHKWYGSAMQVVVNDLYAFNPNEIVRIEEFADVIERNFRQPLEGLGFDSSPSAHMWRTMIWPNNFL